jgi:competence protein ComEC
MLSAFISKNIFLARILPFLALGITIGFTFPIDNVLPFFISLLLIYLSFAISKKGIFVSIFFTVLGFILIQERINNHSFPVDENNKSITANIISSVKENTRSKSFLVETDNGLRIKIYTPLSNNTLYRGDRIHFSSQIKEIKNFPNSSFKYKRYMKTQYCKYCSYTDNIIVIEHNSFKNPILRFSNKIHSKINAQLINSTLDKNKSALLSAMLIGERSQINEESKKEYINAGAIHILAISGLHIGIIYLVISFMLTQVLRIKKSSLIFLICSLLLLWTYAFISFLPSSVLRASLLISFIIISKYIKRESCIYNSIGASAFIILLIDPAALLTPGFQLSYAAYTSIIYFFPKIKSLATFKNKLMRNIWNIFCLSLSAQIGTVLLAALYFGQIANYSILTNLVISIFIPIIIYTSIIWIIIPNDILIITMDYLLATVNNIIAYISHLPGSVSQVQLNSLETLIIYSFIISTFYMLWYKKKKIIWISLSCILLLNIIITIEHFL